MQKAPEGVLLSMDGMTDLSDRLKILIAVGVVPGHQLLDLGGGGQGRAQGYVVVEGVDDGRQIFAHIRLQIPGAVKELLGTVVQVGGDYVVEIPLGIVVVEFLQAVGEQAEGAAEDDPGGIPLLQSPGGVQDALPGGDHIVYDQHVLALR